MFKLIFGNRLSTVVGLVHHDSSLGRALRTAAVLALVAAPLFAPPSANAMNNWETALMGNYSGSNLTNLCGNCHAGFSGREIGNPNRADYWIWTAKGGTPAASSPYYTNDHDMDGFTTGQEYTNSQAGTRPAITVDWMPGYPDKDNDGCIQIYNRLGEVGMPNNVRDIITDGGIGGKGFANYVPWGWDQDDNDPTQGCNLTWPTTPDVAPSGFTTPVTTSDDGNPPSELPAAITNFRASGRINAAIPLVWTAVGDDGMTGNAHSYDLRYTTQAKALASLQCGVGDAAGTSACQVRNRGHWSRMYDLIGGTVDGSGCSVLTKTAGVTIDCVGGNVEWNNGPSNSPLMRAFYEPVPTAPGSAQGCSLAPGQSATCTLTTAPAPSYVLKAQGVAISNQTPVPINTITNGELYWLATRVSDGVLQISGTLEAPTGFTENVSLSNIVAITAGTTGTAITAITGGASISGTSGTISITGLGLTTTSAARLALVRADGSTAHFVVSPTIVGGTSASASFTGLAAGTYTLETQTSAGATTAAWVDAVTVTGTPPVFSSINPNQGGQGATSRLLTLGGTDLAGGTLSFSGTGIASVPVSGSGPFTASINIDAGASATVRDATVTTASGSSTLPSSFTVTAAPTFSCTPAISLTGTVGVAYPTSVCTASGGSPAGTSYTWTPAAVPPSLSAVVSGANSETLTIFGTPTAAGTFATTIRLSDGNGGTIIVPYTIVIAKGTPTITWANPAAITYGTALSGTQLNATASVPGAFVYTPAAGAVLNAGTQTLSVTFTPTDTANYNNASATATLVVNKVTPTITWANPTAITYGTALSGAQLNATASVPGAFVYTPAAGAVLNAGTQTLSTAFTPTDTANYNNASATATLVVNPASQTVTINCPASLLVNANGSCTGSASSGLALSFTASGACTVTSAGAVTAAATEGTCSVTATTALDANYTPNPASASVSFPVTAVPKITPVISCVAPAPITYPTALSPAQFNCSATDPNTLAALPGSSAYSPALGTVLGAGTQTLSVTFTPTDTATYNNGSTTFTLVVNKGTPTITWANPAAITYGTALSGTQLNATASVPGAFVYTPAAGAVLNAGTQTLSTAFTPTDTVNYNNASATATLVVNPASQTVTINCPASLSVNAAGTCTASASSGLALSFVASGACTVTSAGAVTAGAAAGSCSVTATTAFDANYTPNPASASASISITNKVTPVITWPTPAAITYPTALSATQLNATATDPVTLASVPGSFVYTPAAGAVLNAGTQTLVATFTTTDTATYNNATASVTLVVNKATPIITWANPAAITYGTALSGTQLNATANVPGAFAYTPASGTQLSAGTQTLSATFTPTDTINYNNSSATRSLLVNPASQTVTVACPPALTVGAESTCTGSASSGLAISFTTSTPTVCTLTSAGANTVIVTAGLIEPETCTVTATTVLNSNYTPNPASGSDSISITSKLTPLIAWSGPAPITYPTALSATQLNATALDPETLTAVAGTYAYSPAAGAVLNAGTQTLTVTFTPSDTATYNNGSGSVTLVVNKVTPVITWANPTAITYGTALSNAQLNATANVPGGFAYTPASGTVLNAGTQSLSATFTPTNTTNYNTVTVSRSLVVNPASQTVTISCPSSLSVGATGTCTGLASSGLALSFTATGACTVTSAGAVTAAATEGTCNVTTTTALSSNYTPNPASASAGFPVNNKITPVITWPNPTAITYPSVLGAAQLNATANVAGTYAYTPAAGTLLNAGTHTLSVAFTPSDTVTYNSASASVTLLVNKGTPVITCPPPLPIIYPTPLSSGQLNCFANVPGTFTYFPGFGIVVSAGAQIITVSFFPTDTANYNSVSGSISLVVDKGSQSISPISFTGATLPVGGTVTASATATSGLAVTFSSATPGTCTVSQAGAVVGVAEGTCSVVANQNGSSNYNAASQVTQNISVVVTKLNQTITAAGFSPTILSTGGSTTVSATTSSGLIITFTSATSAVCSVGASTLTGNVSTATVSATALGGICTVNADQLGDVTYNPATQVQQNIAVSISIPDLVMLAVSKTATTIDVGQSLIITNAVRNQGTAAADGSTVRFYLSDDNIISSTIDRELTGTRVVSALVAGENSISEETAVTMPYSVLPKTYFVGACVDRPSVVVESNEDNNCKVALGTITVVNNVDLIMETVSKTATSVGVGHSFVITNVERNRGTTGMNSASNTVKFYLSTDATITTTDIALTGTRVILTLPALTSSASAATTVTVPYSVAPRSYYVGACADVPSVQMETYETNNCKAALGVINVVRAVNLQMSAVSKAATVVGVGKSFAITNTEKNAGTTNMTVASNTVKFYLSTDATITTADIVLIGSRSVSRLLAGRSSTSLATTVTVPTTVAPRLYYVGACADVPSVQIETIETDNCKAALGTINVVRNVDLVMNSISTPDATVVDGGSFTITSSVKNAGTAAMLTGATTKTRFYLSTDATITSADILLTGTQTVGALLAGASSASTPTLVTLPASLTPGPYYIGAIADGASQLLESVENNNSNSPSTVMITVTFEPL